MKKSSITAKIQLTNSNIMGDLIILGGLYGFIAGTDPVQSVLLVGIGAAGIGLKQYFQNKTDLKNGNDTTTVG
jgi:hypothetical protein